MQVDPDKVQIIHALEAEFRVAVEDLVVDTLDFVPNLQVPDDGLDTFVVAQALAHEMVDVFRAAIMRVRDVRREVPR